MEKEYARGDQSVYQCIPCLSSPTTIISPLIRLEWWEYTF